jgi:hypothetical protein
MMVIKRTPQQSFKEKAVPPAKQEKAGRTGEGVRSVIPYLKADQKARAANKRRGLE